MPAFHRSTSALLLSALALGSFACGANAAPVITVAPWLAPNAFGSPSFAAAQANALDAMYLGLPSSGAAGPAQFNVQTAPLAAAQTLVTGFASWRGQIDPGTAFGADYAAESGNRMTFAVRIDGQGTQFAIAQLGFAGVSSDAGDVLGFSYAPGSYDYGSGYVGVLFGADGAWGGGDDSFVTGGPNTQLVDGLIGRGSGNSLAAYCSGSCDAADQLAALQSTAAGLAVPLTFSGSYYLVNSDHLPVAVGSASFDIVGSVPEPASWALLAAALAAASLARRRRLR